MSDTLLGFHRLAELYGIQLVQPLFTRSRLGPMRQREAEGGREVRTWTAQYQPADNFRGHFEFGLKYERLNFEFFSRLFHRVDPEEVAAWAMDEPTGSYARRAAFFYEWFTGRQLAVPDTAPNVGYVDAIDAGQYLAAQRPDRVRRWRVNDNLPGLRDFCPMVFLGTQEQRGWLYDVAAGVQSLDAQGWQLASERQAAQDPATDLRGGWRLLHKACADHCSGSRRIRGRAARSRGRLAFEGPGKGVTQRMFSEKRGRSNGAIPYLARAAASSSASARAWPIDIGQALCPSCVQPFAILALGAQASAMGCLAAILQVHPAALRSRMPLGHSRGKR